MKEENLKNLLDNPIKPNEDVEKMLRDYRQNLIRKMFLKAIEKNDEALKRLDD